MRAEIADRVARFPDESGVYIFTDSKGKALYVGKAAKLRSRVRSYLKPGGDGRFQLRFLEKEAHDVEFLVTQTEQEALLLENTIIKKLRPIYNFKLRDDKSFLMLRLDRQEEWPWFRLVRRRKDDGADYFGPYASAKSVRRTLRLLHKVVPLRDCSKSVFDNRSRPCLKHQIGRCPAPCVGLIDRPEYTALVEEAVSVLRGGARGVLRRLEEEMRTAAGDLEFEKAQAKKLQIEALESVAERQSVVESSEGDRDVVGLHRSAAEAVAVILHFRSGRLESSSRFKVPSALPSPLLLEDLLARYYQGDRYVPGEILVPQEVPEAESLLEWLESKRGRSVKIAVPKRGSRRRFLAMAEENARLQEMVEASAEQRQRQALLNLAAICGLGGVPSRIHCMDVSTIQGRDTVASRVCFVDGVPDKSAYRRFKISESAAGDDFSAMSEAVRRSLTQCETREEDDLPDLLVVDGGKGQLSSARESARELGLLDDLCLAGLAKSRLKGVGDERRQSGERLFLVGRELPVVLADAAPETLLLAAVRDESHRFAISYHRRLRSKLKSPLDAIPGIGPTRRRQLIRHFGSARAVAEADLESLCRVPGLSRKLAEVVHAGLRRD